MVECALALAWLGAVDFVALVSHGRVLVMAGRVEA